MLLEHPIICLLTVLPTEAVSECVSSWIYLSKYTVFLESGLAALCQPVNLVAEGGAWGAGGGQGQCSW